MSGRESDFHCVYYSDLIYLHSSKNRFGNVTFPRNKSWRLGSAALHQHQSVTWRAIQRCEKKKLISSWRFKIIEDRLEKEDKNWWWCWWLVSSGGCSVLKMIGDVSRKSLMLCQVAYAIKLRGLFSSNARHCIGLIMMHLCLQWRERK